MRTQLSIFERLFALIRVPASHRHRFVLEASCGGSRWLGT